LETTAGGQKLREYSHGVGTLNAGFAGKLPQGCVDGPAGLLQTIRPGGRK